MADVGSREAETGLRAVLVGVLGVRLEIAARFNEATPCSGSAPNWIHRHRRACSASSRSASRLEFRITELTRKRFEPLIWCCAWRGWPHLSGTRCPNHQAPV